MQLNDLALTGPDSVELAQTLNEIGVLHYLQNNTSLVIISRSSLSLSHVPSRGEGASHSRDPFQVAPEALWVR